ncbi:MAG: hypothetical protein ABIP55_00695, partial [Tepidisphaeraceae bacterium]
MRKIELPAALAGFIELLETRYLMAGETVTQFTLINADTDQPIGALVDGATVNFQTIGTNRLNVVAQTAGTTESVRFALDANSNFRTENSAPFTLAGDSAGDYNPWTPSLGAHTLRGTPFTADNAGGVAGTALQVNFTVVNQGVPSNRAPVLAAIGNKTIAPGATLNVPVSATDLDGDAIVLSATGLPVWASFTDNGNGTGTLAIAPPAGTGDATFNGITITATDNGSPVLSDSETLSITVASAPATGITLTLYNADTDQPIGPFGDGTVINFALLGTTRFSVLAVPPASASSVRFGLDSNSNFRTENSAPYTIAGDSGSDFKPWTPSLGAHTLTVTHFSADNGGGTAGTPLVINFTVVNQQVVDPVALQTSTSSLAFGSVTTGSFVTADVTLTNPSAPGGSSVTVLATSITGSSAFTDNFNDAADITLAPGQSTIITVRFAPLTGGALAGTLSIQHSGTNSPLSITLGGSGIASNTAPVLAP